VAETDGGQHQTGLQANADGGKRQSSRRPHAVTAEMLQNLNSLVVDVFAYAADQDLKRIRLASVPARPSVKLRYWKTALAGR